MINFNHDFTYLFIMTDFRFDPINHTFNLLYIQIMLSVRVAIDLLNQFNFKSTKMTKSI